MASRGQRRAGGGGNGGAAKGGAPWKMFLGGVSLKRLLSVLGVLAVATLLTILFMTADRPPLSLEASAAVTASIAANAAAANGRPFPNHDGARKDPLPGQTVPAPASSLSSSSSASSVSTAAAAGAAAVAAAATTAPFPALSSASASASGGGPTGAPAGAACVRAKDLTPHDYETPETFFEVTRFAKRTMDEWTAEIRPRAAYCCEAGMGPEERVCAGDSVFAVLAKGPSVTTSGIVVNVNEPALDRTAITPAQPARWRLHLRLPPIAGEYTVSTLLEVFHFPRMYDEWDERRDAIRAMASLPAEELAVLYPTQFLHRHVASGGEQTITVTDADVAAMRAPATLPWCTLPVGATPVEQRSRLPGYWVGSPLRVPYFVAFDCRLRRLTPPSLPATLDGVSAHDLAALRELAASESGEEAVADLERRYKGKWLALFGDSNTRNLWAKLCARLGATGAQVIANITQLAEKDRPRDFVCFSTDVLITVSMWWPTNYPQLHERVKYDAAGMVAKSLVTSPDIPSDLLGKERPDRIYVNLGSHDTHATTRLAPLVRKLLVLGGVLPETPPTSCSDGRLLFSTVYATDDTFLAAQATLRSIVPLQNNIRILRTNEALRATFGACAIADFYYTSEGPALAAWFNNAVHPPDPIYHASADIVLNYL